MIFINLLPDVKLDFVRAQRVRRLLVLLSVVIVLCCFVICSFLYFVVEIQQPATIEKIEGPRSQPAVQAAGGEEEGGEPAEAPAPVGGAAKAGCDKQPESNVCVLEEIKSNEDGNTILTIQNQLETLPELHRLKTRPDRLFREPGRSDDVAYLSLLVPGNLGTLETAKFDFETHKFSITGYSENESDALSVHATIRFMGYEECYDDRESGSNRDSRVYPFRINDEPLSGSVGSDQDRVTFDIQGVFSEQLFDRGISDEDLGELGKVPEDAVDPAKLRDPNHPCKLPAGEENLDNPEFEELKEWWKGS